LSITSRNQGKDSSGWVTHALTGEPIKGAKVELWTMNNNREKWELQTTTATDANGVFATPLANQTNSVVRVLHQGDSLATNPLWNYHNSRETVTTETIYLFTDRALYRPGQTLRFKGIAASYDRSKNDYHTRNNQEFEVQFLDLNRKEIAKLQVKSN
jgi:uncharacterized protein YfaS (alpha-2-macroglobulin family)